MKLTDQEITALRETFLFHHMAPASYDRFSRAEHPEYLRKTLLAGTSFSMPRGEEHYLAILTSGNLRAPERYGLPDRIMEPGFVIGALDLFSKDPVALPEVFALGEASVLFISASQMEQMFRDCPEIMSRYIRFLTGQFHALRREQQVFSEDSAESRLLRFLKLNARRDDEGRLVFSLPHSYSKLAQQLHIGRASLYRVFDRLEENRIITREEKTIFLLMDDETGSFL